MPSANRDTRSVGYHHAGVDRRMMTFMLQEVDDMASVVIQEPPSSPSLMAVFAKKVQTIIRRCMVSIARYPLDISSTTVVSPSLGARTDRGASRVKRGARRQLGRGAGGGCPPVPHFPGGPGHADPRLVEIEKGIWCGHPPVDQFNNPNLHIPSFSLGLTQPSQSLLGGLGTLRAPPPPDIGFAPFQSPASTSLGFSLFCAPPPPGTAGSSTPHQPIFQASSSDDEEQTDDTDDVQHFGFGYRVGKKTTRFTPSDWP
ncbi:hypothetical protein M9H77_19352 [Catharanthus roseus]|uniref:Uncharacterized protein n=1 Tax=Catharanthus roseus TaxID=4058 RepID=A0ACC0BA04_CATRO|nr:hypothetical protein M9H77_19352 [Catharanthus roseus]